MKIIPRAFVIGHPVAHSRSPMVHSYWLRQYGLNGAYEMRDVLPYQLGEFIRELRSKCYAGCNVTIPHKATSIPFLDKIDATALAMGAVNTIYWDGDSLVGTNADALGFMRNIDERCPGWAVGASHAVILGAGGAARAAIYGLLERGFTISIFNRTASRAHELARFFHNRVDVIEQAQLASALTAADLLVNATSAGMVHQPELIIDLSNLKSTSVVYDVVYVPLETKLIMKAKMLGHRTCDGLGMLLHQAVIGFELWFGQKALVSSELRELVEADIRANAPGS